MEGVKEEKTCKLCFKIADTGYEVVDDVIKMMFNFLLLKLNWGLDEYAVICQDCANSTRLSYSFKSILVAKISQTKFVLKDTCEGNESTDITIQEGIHICQFCSNQVENDKGFPIEKLFNEPKFVEMLPAFLPEMDININSNFASCIPCGTNFETYCKFISYCLSIEDRINHAFKNENSTLDTNQFAIKTFDNFVLTNNTNNYIERQEMDFKQEIDTFKEYKQPEMLKNDEDEIDTKDESIHKNMFAVYESQFENQRNMENDLLSVENNLNGKIHKCQKCTITYETTRSFNLKAHLLTHKDFPDLKMYKCEHCTYETKHKGYLKSHSLKHKDISEVQKFKCDICPFETKWKKNLKDHKLSHEDVSVIKMYKCQICVYETKWKSQLKSHSLTHDDDNTVKKYKCESCSFETKWKRSIEAHKVVHKNTSEVPMYKCEVCTYESKRKIGLKKHAVIHNDISAMEKYKCDICTYETHKKVNLARHKLSHKEVIDPQMYICKICPYQTRHKSYLKFHMRTHLPDTKILKCGSCSFETKWRASLKHHELTHKDASEVQMHKCERCAFETKHKNCLKTHMLIHQDSSEVKMYKCANCTYETKRKHHLKKHILVHKVTINGTEENIA